MASFLHWKTAAQNLNEDSKRNPSSKSPKSYLMLPPPIPSKKFFLGASDSDYLHNSSHKSLRCNSPNSESSYDADTPKFVESPTNRDPARPKQPVPKLKIMALSSPLENSDAHAFIEVAAPAAEQNISEEAYVTAFDLAEIEIGKRDISTVRMETSARSSLSPKFSPSRAGSSPRSPRSQHEHKSTPRGSGTGVTPRSARSCSASPKNRMLRICSLTLSTSSPSNAGPKKNPLFEEAHWEQLDDFPLPRLLRTFSARRKEHGEDFRNLCVSRGLSKLKAVHAATEYRKTLRAFRSWLNKSEYWQP